MKVQAFVIAFLLLGCSHEKNNERTKADSLHLSSQIPVPQIKLKYISSDSLISFINKAHSIEVNKQAGRPFNELRYNKVIAYDYNGENGESHLNIVENNKLVLQIKKQKELNQRQVDLITNLLSANSTYGNTYAFCFVPHLGIVFYFNHKIVMSVSVSIGCNFLESSLPIPATNVHKISISSNYKYSAKGFSKKSSQDLINFVKVMNFTLQ